jgi:serine/threonine protein kinase
MTRALTPGTPLGGYVIRSKLGAGGMGEVYLAKDTKLDRNVALKLLPEGVGADHDRVRRFVQEARAASALNHPNIMTIYEIAEAGSGNFIATETLRGYGPSCVQRTPESICFIVTEYIDGETLRARMKRERLTIKHALQTAVQIASALSAAHKACIIHRDIKPGNIMIGRNGVVKILDFGIARVAHHQQLASVDTEAATKPLIKTEPGTRVGTAYYMSPEQARGLEVDARTDIWSLGCVLYEMVTGRRPFEGDTTLDVLAAVINREPEPLNRRVPDVPAALEEIVSKALSKERKTRYQTAARLMIDLEHLKDDVEFAAPPLAHRRPS